MLVVLENNSNINDHLKQAKTEFPELVCELAVENSPKNNIYSGHYSILSKVINLLMKIFYKLCFFF